MIQGLSPVKSDPPFRRFELVLVWIGWFPSTPIRWHRTTIWRIAYCRPVFQEASLLWRWRCRAFFFCYAVFWHVQPKNTAAVSFEAIGVNCSASSNLIGGSR